MMTVEADILPADYEAFSRCIRQRVLKTHAPRWRIWTGAIGVGLCVGAMPTLLAWIAGFQLDWKTMLTAVASTWIGLYGYGRFRQGEFLATSGSWVYGHKTFVIEDDVIRQIGTIHEGKIMRSAITDVVVTPAHIFVLFGNVNGWVVPKRAFVSSAAAESFAGALKLRMGN